MFLSVETLSFEKKQQAAFISLHVWQETGIVSSGERLRLLRICLPFYQVLNPHI